jgi:hypothetical protein
MANFGEKRRIDFRLATEFEKYKMEKRMEKSDSGKLFDFVNYLLETSVCEFDCPRKDGDLQIPKSF